MHWYRAEQYWLPRSIAVYERLICLPRNAIFNAWLTCSVTKLRQAAFSLVGRYVMSATHSRSQPMATVLAEQCITPDLD